MCDNIANGQPRVLSVLGSTGGGGTTAACECPPANVIIASNVLSTTGNVIAGNVITVDGTFTGNLYVSGQIFGNLNFTAANYVSLNTASFSFQTANGASMNVASLQFANQIQPTNLPASGVTAGQYGNYANVSSIQVDQYGRVTQAANVAILSSQWTTINGNVAYANGVSIGALANPPPGSNLYVLGNSNLTSANIDYLTVNSAVVFGGTTLNVWGTSNLTLANIVTANIQNLFTATKANIGVANITSGYISNIYTSNISGVTTSQWVGTTGAPIYYVPRVGVGSSATPTANLMVTGNTYTTSLETSLIKYFSNITAVSNTSTATQYIASGIPASGDCAVSTVYSDNRGISLTVDNKTWNFVTNGVTKFPYYNFPNTTGAQNQVLVDQVGAGTLVWSNLVQNQIWNIYSLSLSSSSMLTFPGGLTYFNNVWQYPTTQTTSIGSYNWRFTNTGETYLPGYRLPSADGTAGYAMVTNGSGVVNFSQILNLSKLYVDTVTQPPKTIVYTSDSSTIVISPDQSLTGYAQIQVPNDTTSNLLIQNNGTGGIVLKSNGNQWTFRPDGNAFFPSANIVTANATTLWAANIYTSNISGFIGSQWVGASGAPIYYVPQVGIGSSAVPTANLMVTGNIYASNALTSPALNIYGVSNTNSLVSVTGNVLTIGSLTANVITGNVASLTAASGNVLTLTSLNTTAATGNIYSLSSLGANVITCNVASLASATGNVLTLTSLNATVATGNIYSLSSLAANVITGNVASLVVASLSSV